VSDLVRRLLVALVVIGCLVGIFVLDWRNGGHRDTTANASASMIERFDLFTIIVLGEVVVGVVTGIVGADRSPIAVVTGMLGLGVGFAYWWSYFDLVGARRLSARRGSVGRWTVGHLPVTMTIAATGAVLASMVDHAGQAQAPRASMLLSMSVATGILALVLIASSLADWDELSDVYRPVSLALGLAAVVILLIGWLGPVPWLHVLLITAVLGIVWFFGILTWFARAGARPR
jgi:low temperature requirement protein LtrA